MLTIDEIKDLFEVREDKDLVPIFGRSQGAISKWRSGGVPAYIERRAMEILNAKGKPLNHSNHQTVTIGDQQPRYDDEISAAVAKIMRELSPKGRYEVMHYATEIRMKENSINPHTEE
jgi:hypothetical protein